MTAKISPSERLFMGSPSLSIAGQAQPKSVFISTEMNKKRQTMASSTVSVMGNKKSTVGRRYSSRKSLYVTEQNTKVKDEEWSLFFQTELEWPHSEPSGITPGMLAARPAFKGVITTDADLKQKANSICERIIHPKKAPRPETLPNNVLVIRSDPPTVDTDDVEEFLVHDALFVEFFNAFLALPAFPEPVCFNVETGGFEVVSDGRKKLARQIKEAVRSQTFTKKIYRMARQHAFSDIPLIPIEDTGGPEGVKINTTYNVTVLNKDQGIYWVKAERLPIFLESDFYIQYRLAKVISQAKLFNGSKEFVIMKIDFTPRQKKVKKSVEIPPPKLEDIIVKQMFVSFGDVKGAAKEAWFTQAKDGISTTPKFTTLSPQMSADILQQGKESEQKRPKSSVFRSPYFGTYAPGLVGPGETEPPIQDHDVLNDGMFHKKEDRPFTPRPSQKVHSSTTSARKMHLEKDDTYQERMVKPGHVVFKLPTEDHQAVDEIVGSKEDEKTDADLERRMLIQPIIDEIYHDDSWEVETNVAFRNESEFGSVIVGAVMKKTLADLLSVSEDVILEDPAISKIYPSKDLTCISVNDLDRCYVVPKVWGSKSSESSTNEARKKAPPSSPKEARSLSAASSAASAAEVFGPTVSAVLESETSKKAVDLTSARTVVAHWNRDIKKSAEEESDADSLLDSDEDFEEQDIHFRRRKDKWYNLTSMKGIMNFKKFLSGTPGDKYWELWMDIDRGRLIVGDEEEEIQYINYMRGKYHKQGSPFELSKEDKIKLGLQSPSAWFKEHLFQIQGKVMEPLVLYWAPRYLLKHLLQTDPDKYYMYSALKSCQPSKESDPHPMTKSMIPLRPKSCCPRANYGQRLEEMNSFRKNANRNKSQETDFFTAPKVGNRRSYGEDTYRRLARTPTAKYLGITLPPDTEVKKSPLSRPQSAISKISTVRADRVSASTPQTPREVTTALPAESAKSLTQTRSTDYDFIGSMSLPNLPSVGSSKSLTGVKCKDAQGIDSCKCKSATSGATAQSQAPQRRSLKSLSDKNIESKSIIRIISPADKKILPCPSKKLDILGGNMADQTVSGEVLASVKKPRDLLQPKLKILDTKQQRSRKGSAVKRSDSKELEQVTFYRQDSLDSSKVCDSRPSTASKRGGAGVGAVPEPVQTAEMTDCNFMGSERMEVLLQALHHDKEAGKAFRKFMEKDEESQVASNCFEFWDSVQEYRKLFYKDKLDLFLINKQAKVIFAQFVVSGSAKSIEISESIELQIMNRLRPAYEDLYDDAEEHALKVLFEKFLDFLSQDVRTYCKVERSEVVRHLETKNTYILNLQKKGIIKEGPLTPDDPMDGYVDPVCDESLFDKIPDQFKEWNFDKIVHNRLELEHFRQFLADNYTEIDLKCWMDMEAWRRTPPGDARKRDLKAREIKKQYLNKKYFFGPSSPAGKEGQDKVMEAAGGWGKFLEDKPHHDAILEAQKYVAERLEKKHLPLFLLSEAFQNRQSPVITEEDIQEEEAVRKKRRNQAVLKVRDLGDDRFTNLVRQQIVTNMVERGESTRKLRSLKGLMMRLMESRWVSTTKEIYLFKQAVKNPISCRQFQKFISVRGDNLENDLLFWQEVQHYKEMHHQHTEDSMLMQKINAIVQCFVDSSIPPSLQIDISQDMAERILDHKHEKGPYLFREAQVTVFRILIIHWIPFCEFRNNMGSDEKVMKTLERHRQNIIEKEAKLQEEIDKEKQKAHANKKAVGNDGTQAYRGIPDFPRQNTEQTAIDITNTTLRPERDNKWDPEGFKLQDDNSARSTLLRLQDDNSARSTLLRLHDDNSARSTLLRLQDDNSARSTLLRLQDDNSARSTLLRRTDVFEGSITDMAVFLKKTESTTSKR